MNGKLISLFIFILCFDIGYLFNVDTNFPIIFSQPAETYFGYSVLFHSQGQRIWLLVGAPKANQSFSKIPKSPGTLLQCSLRDNSCSEVLLDTSGNQVTSKYQDLKDNQWLGVSLDENSQGTVVTCAHRWKNQKYYQEWRAKPVASIQDYHTNGLCYTIGRDMRPNTGKRHIPLISALEQVIGWGLPNYAFGMAGMSSHFTEDNKLLLGAPGVFSWEGKLVTINNIASTTSKSVIWAPPRTESKKSNFMYLGYAVASGRFFGSVPAISYIVGAPRYDYVGKIYIIKPTKTPYEVEFTWEGKQLGEYFGAAICAIDLNKDGYDDLLVGSPLHAFVKEEGKVYAFINNKGNGFMLPLELLGSKVEGARFGTSIAVLGDLNLDGFPDFAIGAPYEDGQGVVYIYHGDLQSGIAFRLNQKLRAQEINPNLKGFGISIAKGRDIDRNSYPDIAIGSYESGHAVVLRSYPTVMFHAWVNSSPNKLSINSFPCKYKEQNVSCFNVTTCIRFESPRTMPNVHFEMKLSFDTLTKNNSQRGFFLINGVEYVQIEREDRLDGRHAKCTPYQAFLHPNLKDYLTPIEILYEFKLPEKPKDSFCAQCPVLHPRSKTSVSHQVKFPNICGDDEECYSDLHLNATVIDQQKNPLINPEMWFGLNKTIIFDVFIANSGEAAYLSELNITVPKWSNFVRQPIICSDHTANDEYRYLMCDIGNPLPPKGNISFQLYLDVELAPLDLKELSIDFHVATGSVEESNLLDDNHVVITIPAKLSADITVYGSTPNEYISYANKTDAILFPFTHVYEVVNLGPSLIELAKVIIDVPEVSMDSLLQLITNISITTRDGTYSAKITECRGASSTHLTNEGKMRDEMQEPGAVKRRKRKVNDKLTSTKNSQLFCDKVKCRQIECDIITIAPNDGVKISIDLELDSKILDQLKLSADIIDFTTEARASILNAPSDIQPPNHRPDSVKVITSFDTGHTLPKQLPNWVIPVSIILGIVVLLLMAAVFYKIGFFQRSDREALLQAQEGNTEIDESPENTFHSHSNHVDTD